MGARGLLLVTLVHGIAAPARHRLRPLAAVRMSSSSSPPPPRPPPPPPSLPPSFTVPADATVREALATAETTLQACGDPEAGAAARHLVACAVGETGPQSLSNLQARVVASGHADDVLGAEAAAQLAELMRRRSAREPIQYLIGEWDFHMLTLKVGAIDYNYARRDRHLAARRHRHRLAIAIANNEDTSPARCARPSWCRGLRRRN